MYISIYIYICAGLCIYHNVYIAALYINWRKFMIPVPFAVLVCESMHERRSKSILEIWTFKVKHAFIKLDYCSGINLIMVQTFCFEFYC